jgi:transglutaminase-like putative cysteine protease
MRFSVEHTTSYRYAAPASLCHDLAHLRPRTTARQRVVSSSIEVLPEPDDRRSRLDVHGNHVEHLALQRPHDGLEVVARSVLELDPVDISPAAARPWEEHRGAALVVGPEREMLLASPLVPLLPEAAAYAAPSFPPGRPLLDAVTELTARLHAELRYEPGSTTVATPLEEVLSTRRGVCQDFAHLAVACLRSTGLATRYVSGYLETLPPPGQPKLVGADATHAWCSVRLSDGSWLDLDPTNDLVAPEHHLVVAWGRDYADVVPFKGVVMTSEGDMELRVAVDVTRLPD